MADQNLEPMRTNSDQWLIPKKMGLMYGKKRGRRRKRERKSSSLDRAACVRDESRKNKAGGVFPSGHGITFPCNIIHER